MTTNHFSLVIDHILLRISGWTEQRHLADLVAHHGRLPLIGVADRALQLPPRLPEAYVPLRLFKSADSSEIHVAEMFEGDPRKLVVLGPTGAGKTTLLDYLALVFSGTMSPVFRHRKGPLLPLSCNLRNYGQEGTATVLDLLSASAPRLSLNHVRRRLRRGRSIVLLDGLDELPEENLSAQASDDISTLVAEYPNNWYVVTCDAAAWSHQLNGFSTYEIQDFSAEQIRQFAGSWYREFLYTQGREAELGSTGPLAVMREATERADEFCASLAECRTTCQVVRSPRTLSVAALVDSHRGELPTDPARLSEIAAEIVQGEEHFEGVSVQLKSDLDLIQARVNGDSYEGTIVESLVRDPMTARNSLVDLLKDPDEDRTSQFLRSVSTMHFDRDRAEKVAPVFVDLIGDADQEPWLRAVSARTLPAIGIEADTKTWQALERARNDASELVKSAATWAWCELGRYEELGLVKIPAGEFLMGSEVMEAVRPEHVQYLPTYYIGRSPVTVAEFGRYIEETGRETIDFYRRLGGLNHPVVAIRWQEAEAYATYHGCQLPTEAEWEKAARGTDGRAYPWGDKWRVDHANTREYGDARPRGQRRFAETPVGHFSPHGDSPYGCTDMSGNLWEWTRSRFYEYPYEPHEGRERSPGTLVLRGGSFLKSNFHAQCAFRYRPAIVRWHEFDRVGFRVVVTCPPFSSSREGGSEESRRTDKPN